MSTDLRSALAHAAVRLVAAVAGRPTLPVTILVACGTLKFEEEVLPAAIAALLGPPERPPLTDLEGRLQAALVERESKPAAIAARLGQRLSSHIYEALKVLVVKGYAVRGPRGGYLRAPE
jgi:hypothetical protein